MHKQSLSQLLQLVSPMLPVGAYSYSQGLEWGIESGDITDEATAKLWMSDALHIYQAHFELPILYRLYQSWLQQDMPAVKKWDHYYMAGRDTAEAYAEAQQMGYSLKRLLNELDALPAAFLEQINQFDQPAFMTLYAAIAQHWQINAADALHGFVWSWLENQTSAVMKALPLGQVSGQKILYALGQDLPALVAQAMAMEEEDISNFNPLLTIAGCQHEQQYSRLFRS